MSSPFTASNPPDWSHLRQAVDASGEVIFTTDRTGVIAFVNREFERVYGYTGDEVVGCTTPRILKSGRMSDEWYANFWQTVSRGETVRGEFVNRTKAGDLVYMETSVNPIRDPEGEIAGYLAVQRDISARKRTEAALRESEVRYRTLAESAHDAIFILGLDGRFQYMNEAAASPFDRAPAKVVGRHFSEFFQPEAAAWIEDQIRQVHHTRVALYAEQAMDFPQGKTWQSAWLAPIFDADGEVASVMGIARDITAQRSLAALLERQNGLLNAIVERSPVGIAVLDGSSLVCNLVNPALEQMVATGPMLGAPFASVWPGDAADIITMFERVLATGLPQECVDVSLPDAAASGDGPSCTSATVWASSLGLPGNAVPSVLVLVSNTTRRKQLEAQFYQAQKMEAVGRLAGGVAHDFNNLLTSILGYSELLVDTFAADDARREDLQEIRRAGQSAATLTRQLLAFSRKQIADPVVLDVNLVVKQFDKIVRRTIGEDVAVDLRLDPTVEPVKIDPGQLEQVLMNLSVNARDAMPQGGTLRIETRNVVFETRDARRRWIAPGRYVSLTISDTGSGMSKEVQSHLFEPFYTTKEFGKGTGLGLSTVYGIVKQHGGYIDVVSEVGRGTSVTLYVPQAGQAERPRIDDGPHEACPHGRETVLVVEDNDALRALACRILEGCGYRTLGAPTARAALRLSRTFREPIDLLLTDVVMPGADGLALGRHLTRHRPNTRVMYMSGHTEDVISRHGLLNPSVEFLQKPFTRERLAQKVREVLDETSTAGV
jgi:PAS domain S-box-containing protein